MPCIACMGLVNVALHARRSPRGLPRSGAACLGGKPLLPRRLRPCWRARIGPTARAVYADGSRFPCPRAAFARWAMFYPLAFYALLCACIFRLSSHRAATASFLPGVTRAAIGPEVALTTPAGGGQQHHLCVQWCCIRLSAKGKGAPMHRRHSSCLRCWHCLRISASTLPRSCDRCFLPSGSAGEEPAEGAPMPEASLRTCSPSDRRGCACGCRRPVAGATQPPCLLVRLRPRR